MAKLSEIISRFYIKNKDLKQCKDETLHKLATHEKTVLFTDIIAIILFVTVFFYVVRNQIYLFSGIYNYSLHTREISIIIGYVFSWIAIFFIGINIVQELQFGNIIYDLEERPKKISLTVRKNEKTNEKDNNRDTTEFDDNKEEKNQEKDQIINNEKDQIINQEDFRKLGEIPIEKPFLRIIFYAVNISIIIGAMYYYLPFNSRFPSFIEVSNQFGQISPTDYLSLLIIMFLFLMSEIFLLIINIFGNISRKKIIDKIIYFRIQKEIFAEISVTQKKGNKIHTIAENSLTKNQTQNQSEILFQNQSEILSQNHAQTQSKQVDEKEIRSDTIIIPNQTDKADISIKTINQKHVNIFNTPIDTIRERKQKEIDLKKKLTYLKEREKLLDLIQKDRLMLLYGKKGYKEYLKEKSESDKNQQIGKKERKEKKEISKSGDYSIVKRIDGYKILNSEQTSSDSDKKINSLVKEKVKDKKEKIKKKTKKQKRKFDFR